MVSLSQSINLEIEDVMMNRSDSSDLFLYARHGRALEGESP